MRMQTVQNKRTKRKAIRIVNALFIAIGLLLIAYPIVFLTPPSSKLDKFATIPFFDGLVALMPSLVYEPFAINIASFGDVSKNFIAFVSFYLWCLVLVTLVFLVYSNVLVITNIIDKNARNKPSKITIEIIAFIINFLCLTTFLLYCLPQSIENSIPFVSQLYSTMARWFDGDGILRKFNFFKNSYVSVEFYVIIVQVIVNLFITGYVIITSREKKSSYGSLVNEVKKGGNRPIMQEKQDYQIIPNGLFTKKAEKSNKKRDFSSVGYKMATDSFDGDDDKKVSPTNQESRIFDSLEPVNLDALNNDNALTNNELEQLISSNELSKDKKDKKNKKHDKKENKKLENNVVASDSFDDKDIYQKDETKLSKKELKKLAKEEKKNEKKARKEAKKVSKNKDNTVSISSQNAPDVEDGVMIVKGENPQIKATETSINEVPLSKKELKKLAKEEKKNKKKNKGKKEEPNETPAVNEEIVSEEPNEEVIEEKKVEKPKLRPGQAIQPNDDYETTMSTFDPSAFNADFDGSDAVYGDTFPGEEDDLLKVAEEDTIPGDNNIGGSAKVVYETIHEYKYSTEQTTLYKRWQDKIVRFFDIFYIVIFTLLALVAVLLFTPLKDLYFDELVSFYVVRQVINMVPTRFYTPFNLTNPPLPNWGQSADFMAIVTLFIIVTCTAIMLLQVHLACATLNHSKRRGKSAMWFRTFVELLIILANLFILVCFYLLCFRNELYEVPYMNYLYDTFDLVAEYISLDSPIDVLRNFNFNLNPKAMTLVYSLVAIIVVDGLFHLLLICGRSHPLAFKWKKEYRRIASESGKVVKHIVGRGRGYGLGLYSQVFANGYGDGIPTHVEYENYNDKPGEKNVILVKYKPIASIIATMYNDVPAKLAPDLTIYNEVVEVEETGEKIVPVTLADNNKVDVKTSEPETYQRWFLPVYVRGFYHVTSEYDEVQVHNLYVSYISYMGDREENIDGLARAMSIFYSIELALDAPYETIYNPWGERPFAEDKLPEFTTRALEIFNSLESSKDAGDVIDPHESDEVLKAKAEDILSSINDNLLFDRAKKLYDSIELSDNLSDVYSPFEDTNKFIGDVIETEEILEDQRIGELFKESLFMDRALSLYNSLDLINKVSYNLYSPFDDEEKLHKQFEDEEKELEDLTLPVEVVAERREKARAEEIKQSLDYDGASLFDEVDSPFEKVDDSIKLPDPWPEIELAKIDLSKLETVEDKSTDDRAEEIADSLSPNSESCDISDLQQEEEKDRAEDIAKSLSPDNEECDLTEHVEITDNDIDDRAYYIYLSLGEEHDGVKLIEKEEKVVDPFVEEELPASFENDEKEEIITPVDETKFDFYEVVKAEDLAEETPVETISEPVQEVKETPQDDTIFDFYEVVKEETAIEETPVETKVEETTPAIEEETLVEDDGEFEAYEVVKEDEPTEEEQQEEPIETKVEETPTVVSKEESIKDTEIIETSVKPIEEEITVEETPVELEAYEVVKEDEPIEEEPIEVKEEEKEEVKQPVISKPKKPIVPVAPIKHEEETVEAEEEKVLEKINKPLHDIQAKKPEIKIKPVEPKHVPFNLKEFMIDKYDGYLTPEEAFTRGIAKVRSTVSPVIANRGNTKADDISNISTVDDLSKYRNQPKFVSTASHSKSIRELKKAIEEDKLRQQELEKQEKENESNKPNKPITPIKPVAYVATNSSENTEEKKEDANNDNKVMAPVSIKHRLNTKPKPVIKPVDPTKKK